MFGNDKLSRMTNFRERQIFGYDEFLGGIFLTFNLLPVASFRIGVPSILFISVISLHFPFTLGYVLDSKSM